MQERRCIICHSSFPSRVESAQDLHNVSIGSSRRQARRVHVEVCPRCGLGFQSPLPTDAELAALYEGMADQVYIDETDSRRLSAKLGVRLLRRYLGEQRGRLLDVGCATGIFLDAAQKEGWDVEGIEPSRYMRDHALKGVAPRIREGVFLDMEPGEPYDLISFWDVLEHVRDPRQTLEHAAKLLRPGGLLVVNVPNRESLLARIMRGNWPLLLPEHLFYFSPKSLRYLLESAGFSPVGTHLHPVFFRMKYVYHRLKQHLPVRNSLDHLMNTSLGSAPIPILMGETTMISYKF